MNISEQDQPSLMNILHHAHQNIGHIPSDILSDGHHSSPGHITEYHLSHYFELAVECINSFAGLIVLAAVLLAGTNLLIISTNVACGSQFSLLDPLHGHQRDGESRNMKFKSSVLRIRLILGEQIALALALLVASDILDTVLKPSHAYELLDVVKMGFVTILRTGLAYFLAKEIKELEEEKKSELQGHEWPKSRGSFSCSQLGFSNPRLNEAEFGHAYENRSETIRLPSLNSVDLRQSRDSEVVFSRESSSKEYLVDRGDRRSPRKIQPPLRQDDNSISDHNFIESSESSGRKSFSDGENQELYPSISSADGLVNRTNRNSSKRRSPQRR